MQLHPTALKCLRTLKYAVWTSEVHIFKYTKGLWFGIWSFNNANGPDAMFSHFHNLSRAHLPLVSCTNWQEAARLRWDNPAFFHLVFIDVTCNINQTMSTATSTTAQKFEQNHNELRHNSTNQHQVKRCQLWQNTNEMKIQKIYFTQGSIKQACIRVHAWYRRMTKPKHDSRSHTVYSVLWHWVVIWFKHATSTFRAKVKLKSNYVPPKWWHPHPTL